ncbi:hypothetical protein, partial [uncultured Parasphingopyxis sp.]|uniref:hypothetical protein n=1 Tax=uncultured Parasphingopyxis sp. TaxID=1547918 RepID=UPI002627752B
MKNIISKNNLEKNIGVWGILNTENNFRVWKEIKKSDRIIFLHNKKFFSKAKVIGIKENKEIPKKIWKDSTFIENRNLLIFLENIEPIDLDYETCIPMIIEPNMSDAYYFSIIKVNEKKRDFLITTFGSVEKALEFLDNTKGKNSISDFLTRKQLAEETDMVIKEGINKQRIG